MPATLRYLAPAAAIDGAPSIVFVGRRERLLDKAVRDLLPASVAGVWEAMLDSAKPGDAGAVASTWTGAASPARVLAAVLPEPCSRYNSPARPHAIAAMLAKEARPEGDHAVVLVLDDDDHAFAAGCAASRAHPTWSDKGTAGKDADDGDDGNYTVSIGLLGPDGPTGDAARLDIAARSIRLAAELVDIPPSVLSTTEFQRRALELAAGLDSVTVDVIGGIELEQRGFGGLWGVGKAAVEKPSLVVLTHDPGGATETVVLVGKGIVYDTGGLSIKGKDHMPGMKIDMGGSAAVLAGFVAAARSGARQKVHALLCLAENSVGPESTRPDDILHMYSGKTVEVNNTDAEGRLVLADGVAYASKHLAPDVIVDMATLTGAQLIATGQRHAAIVCNDEGLEAAAVAAGKRSGDLVHALPYCPEFFRKEFRSRVADMKNSVKDRMNAQSSCAGQFVAEHLVDYEGKWLHVDMAGPVSTDERGTGYGVALLMELFGFGA